MEFTNDFFIQAQGVIERVFRDFREELIAASGNIAAEQKADKTRVTELDKKVETTLREALKAFHAEIKADIGIEGEEFGIEGSRQTFWLIDPIDGTEAFIRGLPYFRNMVALIDNGKPIFTLIYQPVQDALYVAAEGEGAFRNGKPIHMKPRPLNQTRFDIHHPGKGHAMWQLLERLSQSVGELRITGDFASVAEGKMDGLLIYDSGGGPWDFAPRALLLKEAGAKITNIGSDGYDYTINNMLAAPPEIFDAVLPIIEAELRT